MDYTSPLVIATFVLAVVAAVSAAFTAWMACETRKSRKLTERWLLPQLEKVGIILPK